MTEHNTAPSSSRRRTGLLLFGGLVLVAIGAVIAAALGAGGKAAPATSPSPAAASPTTGSGPLAVFLGDSYTQGFGASPVDKRWSTLVADESGWTEANQGQGGTGYVATSGVRGCGLTYCPSYLERVPDVIDAAPDIVVIAGGQNDRSALVTDPDKVRTAVDATFDGIRQGLPNARIVAVGPSTAEAATPLVIELDSWVQAAAKRTGADYVSLIEPPVIEAGMIAYDGVHVSNSGHRAIADRVLTVARSDD